MKSGLLTIRVLLTSNYSGLGLSGLGGVRNVTEAYLFMSSRGSSRGSTSAPGSALGCRPVPEPIQVLRLLRGRNGKEEEPFVHVRVSRREESQKVRSR